MANDRTQAILASQWKALEKELLAESERNAALALYNRAKEMLSDYRDYTSYEKDSGNMDASVMGAIYHKGKLMQLARYTNSKASEYTVRGDVDFVNRYGNTVSYSKGDVISGSDASYEEAKNYKSSGNFPRLYELIFFGEMFYRYALESKDYIDFFKFYEYNYEREQRKIYEDWYKRMRYGKLAKKIIFK